MVALVRKKSHPLFSGYGRQHLGLCKGVKRDMPCLIITNPTRAQPARESEYDIKNPYKDAWQSRELLFESTLIYSDTKKVVIEVRSHLFNICLTTLDDTFEFFFFIFDISSLLTLLIRAILMLLSSLLFH